MKRIGLVFSILYLWCALTICPQISVAQSSVVPEPGCDPLDPNCPIDGGISLLIAVGISLGAKKAYSEHKKALENNS